MHWHKVHDTKNHIRFVKQGHHHRPSSEKNPWEWISMTDTRTQLLTKIFQYVCSVCAFLLICQCIRQYSLDKDVAEIKFNEFQEALEDIYPSITFCHRTPFIQEKIETYDKNLTIASYKEFLAGNCFFIEGVLKCGSKKWNKTWINIDYDKVTFHIKDFLTKFFVFFLNNDLKRNDMVSYVMKNELLLPNLGANAKE